MINLKKNKIYKLRVSFCKFKRDYLLFSPKEDHNFKKEDHNFILYPGMSASFQTHFTIDLLGNFETDSSCGICSGDSFEPLNINDFIEIGTHLKGTQYMYNLKKQELIPIKK